MGVTLDDLLENSGLNSLRGDGTAKTASEDALPNDLDLVSELRKLASQEDVKAPVLKEEAARELAEKTAEIMVIRQTMQEIDKIASLGVPEEAHNKLATFIKVAIDKGHSENEIAEFLEKSAAGIMERAGRAWKWMRHEGARKGVREGVERAVAHTKNQKELLRTTLIRGNPSEIATRMERLEGALGKENLEKLVGEIGKEGTRIPSVARGYMPRNAGGATRYSIAAGGKELGSISKDHAQKGALATLGLGTGFAVANKGSDRGSGGGGVTIVKNN